MSSLFHTTPLLPSPSTGSGSHPDQESTLFSVDIRTDLVGGGPLFGLVQYLQAPYLTFHQIAPRHPAGEGVMTSSEQPVLSKHAVEAPTFRVQFGA